MKANRKHRDHAVASVTGTMITLPIAMLIVGATMMWGNSILQQIENYEQALDNVELNKDEIDVENITLNLDSNIYWKDEFEGEQLQWHKHSKTFVEANHGKHYYTKGHSAKVYTTLPTPSVVGIYKNFSWQPFRNVSIEIAFTIDSSALQEYTELNIYQDGDKQEKNGTLRLYHGTGEIYIFNDSGMQLIENINLYDNNKTNHFCWHTMRLIVDFKEGRYISGSIDRKYLNLKNYELKNNTDDGYNDSITVEYNYKYIGSGIEASSYVDDFVFRKLSMIKESDYSITSSIDNPPNACYTWTDADGVGPGTLINFDASCSSDNNGISDYEWDLDDDGNFDDSSGITTNYNFSDTNPHTVGLRVTDTIGQIGIYTDTVQAIASAPLNPPEVLSTTPADGETNVAVDQDIEVVFSETMDTSIEPKLNQISAIQPGYCGEEFTFSGWSSTNVVDDTATWTHDPWQGGSSDSIGFTEHVIEVGSGMDDYTTNPVFSCDIDGDSDNDVLVSESDNYEIVWWKNRASCQEWEKVEISSTYDYHEDFFAEDIDGDSEIDLVGIGDDGIAWFENNGDETFSKHELSGVSEGDYIQDFNIHAADIDDDNDVDIIGGGYTWLGWELSWWENDGSESFTKHLITTESDVIKENYVEDINGNGLLDIVSAIDSDGIFWYENDGDSNPFTGNSNKHDIFSSYSNPLTVVAADLNSDNEMDILASNMGMLGSRIIWYENDGSESFTEREIDTDLENPYSLYAVDLNNDLNLDITVISDEGFFWMENDGSESFTKHLIYPGTNPTKTNCVYPIDIDKDLDVDILANIKDTCGEDELIWWENNNYIEGDKINLIISDYYDTDGNLGSDSPYSWNFSLGSTGYNEPTANLSAGEPYTGSTGSPVTFDASLSHDNDEGGISIDRYRWDWNNDGTWDTNWSNSPTESHTWNSAANDIVVAVQVEDDEGEINTTSTLVIINASVSTEPFFTFRIQTTSPNEIFSFQTDNAENLYVDWGDGSDETLSFGTSLRNHIYSTAGTYNVSLQGTAKRISFYEGTEDSLIDILSNISDGITGITSSRNMFRDTDNFGISSISEPGFFDEISGSITNMRYMFYNSTFNQEISNWDVSNVTNMHSMFSQSSFNQNINNWDVSKVKNMGLMFYLSSFNQSIDEWDVSNVTNMEWMFCRSPFNKPINNWDVSKVTDMSLMFSHTPFNQPIDNWIVSNVTTMRLMFSHTPFNQEIGIWDVSNVTDMGWMFVASQFNQPINSWDVSKVTNMNHTFGTSSFNRPLDNWDVSNVTSMRFMFSRTNFNQNIGNWDVSNVEDMSCMFHRSQFNKPIQNWNVSNVQDMSLMFSNNQQFNQDIGNWDVSNVEVMTGMFSNSQFNRDIGNWTVSKVTNMSWVFYNSIFKQNIGNWDVSNVEDMRFMLSYTPMSTADYDSLLISWNNLSLQNDVTLGADGLEYCSGEDARNNIIANYGWTIEDGGKNCP